MVILAKVRRVRPGVIDAHDRPGAIERRCLWNDPSGLLIALEPVAWQRRGGVSGAGRRNGNVAALGLEQALTLRIVTLAKTPWSLPDEPRWRWPASREPSRAARMGYASRTTRHTGRISAMATDRQKEAVRRNIGKARPA